MKYLLVLMIFSSCAQMKEDWILNNCNKESAYSAGLNAGNAGEKSDLSSYGMCPQESKSEVQQAYLKGYEKARSNPINVIKDIVGLNSYKCELRAFAKTYTSTSRRLEAAKRNVMRQCQAQHHRMHCYEPECTKLNF